MESISDQLLRTLDELSAKEDVNEPLGSWREVASKTVEDSDGSMTDYTWYTDGDKHIFMFGDKDIYTPDEEYADWVAETEEEARDWYDNYHGFADEQAYEAMINTPINRRSLEDSSVCEALHGYNELEALMEYCDHYGIKTLGELQKLKDEEPGKDIMTIFRERFNFDENDMPKKANEDTVKQGEDWVNKGKEGTHGKFKTKKAADAQRKAMFASGYRAAESVMKNTIVFRGKK